MSAAEAEQDVEEEEEASEDVPAIDDEERAVLPSSIDPDEIEDETSPDRDDEQAADEDEEADDGDGDEQQQTASPTPTRDSSTSWGDQYVATLAVLVGALASEYGDGDPKEAKQKVEDLATGEPFDLASSVDELLEESGTGADLPPGKALVVGSGVVVLIVLLQETDLMSIAMDRLSEEIDL